MSLLNERTETMDTVLGSAPAAIVILIAFVTLIGAAAALIPSDRKGR
ncbi:MAG: hypothetical protein QOH47_2442 [Sphingomonadales bacterium]|jgi:hypothetical protein|nr:hypothetical protein [Sphingomonadales bacterium]